MKNIALTAAALLVFAFSSASAITVHTGFSAKGTKTAPSTDTTNDPNTSAAPTCTWNDPNACHIR